MLDWSASALSALNDSESRSCASVDDLQPLPARPPARARGRSWRGPGRARARCARAASCGERAMSRSQRQRTRAGAEDQAEKQPQGIHRRPSMAPPRTEPGACKNRCMERDVIRRRVIVHGRVQGVFFRDSLRASAQDHGVSGWARNRPTARSRRRSRVVRPAVAEVVGFCETGPPDGVGRAGRRSGGGAGRGAVRVSDQARSGRITSLRRPVRATMSTSTLSERDRDDFAAGSRSPRLGVRAARPPRRRSRSTLRPTGQAAAPRMPAETPPRPPRPARRNDPRSSQPPEPRARCRRTSSTSIRAASSSGNPPTPVPNATSASDRAPSSSATRSVDAVARRMIDADVGPPSSIVAAWITHRHGISPPEVATADRRGRSGRRRRLSASIAGPPAREIAPATPPAVHQLRVGRVGDRVDLKRRDVDLEDLDRDRAVGARRRSASPTRLRPARPCRRGGRGRVGRRR